MVGWGETWSHSLGEKARVKPERRREGLKENGNGEEWTDEMASAGAREESV